ncbi:hypothetical protein KHX94_18965 [Shewanella dokdonensis]|uniref:Uncharacterized protein n=2 Tax=Shewanella dokdonensis TaxID=712036 RepID=A0ABX8DH65_9GAMM|nr:hypothetical protein [Shewanella dokdonensis]QVK23137.1 hypothetical protein KHX94_18965 [Shewanella dokdonensis]
MAVKVGKKHLQEGKYKYTWSRDKGDGEYAGKLDQIKVDKDEGYEVLYFIQSFMNKHGLTTTGDVHKIEDALHSPKLSTVVMREYLVSGVESILGY